uniref:Uncharacterized protein n=1 Tax=Peromyscus maniculatus bairdii TaxID=230844 RepID=A0A8C8W3I0_PERMB
MIKPVTSANVLGVSPFLLRVLYHYVESTTPRRTKSDIFFTPEFQDTV